jgi:hypothetical protein
MIGATRRLSVSYWKEWRTRAKHFARMQRERLEIVQILNFFLINRIRSACCSLRLEAMPATFVRAAKYRQSTYCF